MICSIIFNNQRVSAFLFKEVKKNFVFEKEIAFEEDISGDQLIIDQDALKNFLFKYFHSYKDCKFYVLLDGMDIQYKTVPYSGVDLTDDMDNKRIEDTILTAAKMNLPKELAQLHASYTTCVMNAEQNDLGYLFSLAFFPSDYLFNIKIVFNDCGLNLMSISPLPFGIFNAVNKRNKLFVTSSDKSISVFNASGIYVWAKPDGCQLLEDDLIDTVITDARKSLNADESEFEELTANNISDYLRSGFVFENPEEETGIDVAYAFGQLLPLPKVEKVSDEEAVGENPEENFDEQEYDEDGNVIPKRKGVLANVTDKLREFLHLGGSEDSEI